VTRLLPGALGNAASSQQESFTHSITPNEGATWTKDAGVSESAKRAADDPPSSTCGSGGLLDYPHYTRPAEFRGMAVPEVLVNGNHDEIRRWRRRCALRKTLQNRPDLLREAQLSEEDRKLLAQIEGKIQP
jgi:tRNA (guanine37-N1)-methyltransferase